MVPKSLMFATAGGIGLFLAFLGLQTAEGIGLVTYEPATLVTLGACPIEKRVNQFSITADGKNSAGFPVCRTDENGRVVADVGPASPNYGCVEGEMTSPSFWLGVMGGMAMVVLIAKGVRGAVVVGIAFITFISWIPNHGATYIGASSQLPGGAARKAYFEKVVELPDTSKTTGLWDFSEFGNSNLWAALFTFLYLVRFSIASHFHASLL